MAKKKKLYRSIPDPTSFIGVIVGVILLSKAIGIDKALQFFYSPSSMFIVLGGTFAAGLVHFPITQLLKTFSRLKIIFLTRKPIIGRIIDEVVCISEKMKLEGKMSIVNELEMIKEPFLRHGIQLIIDKVDPQEIKLLLREEIKATMKRHSQGHIFFDTMARYSPGFGLLGTLIGLIMMLSNLQDPSAIGPNMGIALITTFYGILLSTLVFTPLAGRLEILSDEEALLKEMIVVGIASLASDNAPLVVKEKMLIFLSRAERKKHGS